jgi:two-component system sensor histidine kinase HydH
MGVIEIEKDLSKNYFNIIRLQGRIIIVSSVLMAVLFLVLRSIVSRGSIIIEKRAVERLKLEEKLNRSERLAHLGKMVATVSHEIKSPLGIVRSTAEILEKRIKKIAPGNEHLASIVVAETIRLNNIVVEFLDFARPQTPNFGLISVNEVVYKVLAFLSAELKRQRIELITDLGPNLSDHHIDPNLFYRALLNILVNSMQAVNENGKIQISTAALENGTTELKIHDDGNGMSEDIVTEIFKPFYTDKHKGTGLGLAITKNIIDSHGGNILVSSVEGEGTTFTIILPVSK